MPEVSARTRHARALFAPLGPTYDRYAGLLSFGQDPRWRRFLVSRLEAAPNDTVLDVATGTAAVAIELVRQHGCDVVGVDQSAEMLAGARLRLAREPELAARVELAQGEAERLAFAHAEFDHLTFTYLLRYVDDPGATLAELARVVKPGGRIASLEFGVPAPPVWRPLWRLYTRVGLPGLGRLFGRDWYEVGRFLGPNIEALYERWPLGRQLELWQNAGISRVRQREMSLGGGVVTWGVRDE